ncbi:hypothetical protein SISSUDRAFT_983859 [Sistotremastrum suecicum HHB10207 ss-3]|uniref:F-box domain-containing protein n=1 Tax=Sistotremastrum suecicum HHB10207 ss-3 TaxID=1314776 RepID=A0A166EZR8_9AGAM|nr:hypothetical protein SISSUDRAFT_983859 [Sistotremastrum suecicum HHB10207 ss-3]
MDKWTTLEPVKLYNSATTTGARFLSRNLPSKVTPQRTLVGRLPDDLHAIILAYIPVPDIPAYSRTCRALSNLVRDGHHWQVRWDSLSIVTLGLGGVLDEIEARQRTLVSASRAAAPATIIVDDEDDFGDFSTGQISNRDMDFGDFVGFTATPAVSTFPSTSLPIAPTSSRAQFIRAHTLLKSILPSIQVSPHLILSTLFPPPLIPLQRQSQVLRALLQFLSPAVEPLRNWKPLRYNLRAAIDRFEASLLTAFDNADSKKNVEGMKEVAWASWEVWHDEREGEEWELGKVWAEKREVFYESGHWNPLKNFTSKNELEFNAMDEFMAYIMHSIREDGDIVVRVFPPASGVLLAFSTRLANEVVSEYIISLLTRAREISNLVFLQATAASFVQAWKMVDSIMETDAGTKSVTTTQAEDVVYRMFETNMDEYLDEEIESLRLALDAICRDWEAKVYASANATSGTQFLSSQNPAQVKRNVLASFTNVLLMPVTIVPRVGAFVATSGTAAANSIAMLNPQRWTGASRPQSSQINLASNSETTANLSVEDGSKTASAGDSVGFERLQLLLSLDVSLEIIHAARESLKRAETFQGYPGRYGHRVRETIEELFILMLQTLSERHILSGFSIATEQMRTYKPAEHEETASVAPLMQFFELVHIGDTIQSMIQVFFDKEMAPHIDRTDFLNGVVREKKHFENILDESVAKGLNAGTEVLMNQVEHIIWTRTEPREYYPQEGAHMELGPTKGCTEAITCLEKHCKLLKGSTNKEVLEVFYQEVGIRLHGILQKHLKRQIISLEGGFQVIADLNAYHAFIASLKVPAITSDFANLKMLGHVYIVSDAKDLAQIVRDVARYGGSFRPEDIYEFIQRRSDWKKIEKTVDKTMYNLSFKEDCIIS